MTITLTPAQIVALNHAMYHSLGRPMTDCRRCKRLRKKLARGAVAA